jgi:hypothetical protein
MGKQDELSALRTEVAALREELRQAREMAGQQIHHHYAPMPSLAPCTCGNTAPCQVHPTPWWGNAWVGRSQNLCGGAAGPPLTFVLKTGGANPLTYIQSFVNTGCAPHPQVLTLNS